MSANKIPQLLPTIGSIPAKRTKQPVKSQFSLGTEFFNELIYRLEDKEAEWAEMFRRTSTKRRYPIGWVEKSKGSPKAFTNLGQSIISELVETVFWASLQKDEGRSLRFSVCYRCMTEEVAESASLFGADVVFETPIEFNVRELAKLGPAIANSACILVSADGRNKLWIKGISNETFLPLRIRILDPGHLTLHYRGDNIAFVSGSEVGFIRYSSFTVNTASVWAKLFPEVSRTYDEPRVQTITQTLRRVRDLGHGGCLIVVPKKRKLTSSIDIFGYKKGEGFPGISQTLSDYAGEDAKSTLEFYKEHYATSLAQLTAVDGATIITKDLELVSFGTKLKLTKAPEPIYRRHPIDHPDNFQKVSLSELGNLRHQSAARFVAKQKDSVAFVVSQDGNVTSFVSSTSTDGSAYLLADARLDLTF